MTFGAAWTLKTELPPTRELNFHKIAEFRKIRKSTKKWSEKRPPGRDKNRLCDPICLRVGGLAAPAGTNMCPCGSTMQKTSKAGPPDTKKLIQDTEKQRKTCMESAQKRPSAEKERASCVRGSKNTGEHHGRAAGAPENRRRASEKTREEKRTTSYTNDAKKHSRFPENQKTGPRHKKNTEKPVLDLLKLSSRLGGGDNLDKIT